MTQNKTKKEVAESFIEWIEEAGIPLGSVHTNGDDHYENLVEAMLIENKCSVSIRSISGGWVTVFLDWNQNPDELLTEWTDCDEETDTLLWNFNWAQEFDGYSER